jgi:hypothetical protein
VAKNAITDYSSTAASNTDVGGVDIQGTAPASNMDNAGREIMSHLAETNAGTAPWADTMTIGDTADLTKEVRFELSGITTATTRVLTVPNFDGTIATLAGTETLTNKTLTDPLINGYKTNGVLLTSGSFTGANVDVVLTTYISAGFTKFRLDYDDWRPATDNALLYMRVSTDAGSSFKATGYGGQFLSSSSFAATTPLAAAAPTSSCQLSGQTGNAGGTERAAGHVTFARHSGSTYYYAITQCVSGTPSHVGGIVTGIADWADIDAIQLLPSSGNHTSGTYTLYGIRKS